MTAPVGLVRGIRAARDISQRRLRFAAALALIVLGVGMLTGCSFLGSDGPNIDDQQTSETDIENMREQERITNAIIASDDRIVGVRQLKRTMSGFASGMLVVVDVSSAEPLSAQTVKNILDAVWETTEQKPIDFELIAVVEGTESEGVDVREAATELVGGEGWIKGGNKGAAILSGALKELMGNTN